MNLDDAKLREISSGIDPFPISFRAPSLDGGGALTVLSAEDGKTSEAIRRLLEAGQLLPFLRALPADGIRFHAAEIHPDRAVLLLPLHPRADRMQYDASFVSWISEASAGAHFGARTELSTKDVAHAVIDALLPEAAYSRKLSEIFSPGLEAMRTGLVPKYEALLLLMALGYGVDLSASGEHFFRRLDEAEATARFGRELARALLARSLTQPVARKVSEDSRSLAEATARIRAAYRKFADALAVCRRRGELEEILPDPADDKIERVPLSPSPGPHDAGMFRIPPWMRLQRHDGLYVPAPYLRVLESAGQEERY